MRILIVEDEYLIATSIKKGLEQEHFIVDVVRDGEKGFDLAMVEKYDLIILDLMLPVMDGLSVCKELRKNNIYTKILMLTAKSQTKEKVEGLNAGADDYLSKPFSFEELLARIKALTRRPDNLIEEKLTVADLEMNLKTYEVKRNGKFIKLSSKEFSLLEFLIKNKNRILKKNEIINYVWNYDSDILPNTIEVYVRNLRKKIDVPFLKNKNLIKTIRGFGYKIED